jgi:hypothetical protein
MEEIGVEEIAKELVDNLQPQFLQVTQPGVDAWRFAPRLTELYIFSPTA